MDRSELAERLQRRIGDRYRIEADPPGFPQARLPWTLFLATERDTGGRVAIKAIDTEHVDPLFGLRFEKEVGSVEEAAGWLGQPDLGHPRLLPILSRNGRDGLLRYVTPWLAEGSLRTRFAREPRLPVAEAVQVLEDVAGALAVLHARGYVHRGLKPENILFDQERAVLADGVSRNVRSWLAMEPMAEVDYESPEELRSRPLDCRSDIHALGAVGFEMLVGQRPFSGSAIRVAFAKLNGPPPSLASLRLDVPPRLAEVLGRAMAMVPDDRFADAAVFRAALRAAATA